MLWYLSYIFIVIYSSLGLISWCTDKNEERNYFFTVSFILVFIFIFYLNYCRIIEKDSLNYSDYFYYLQQFNILDIINLHNDDFMIGFRLWTWINSIFYNDVHIYFAFTACLMLFLVFLATSNIFDKNMALVISIIFAMFPWFSLYSSSGIRQGISLCFMLLSLAALINFNLYKSIFWLLFSLIFHKVSIVFIIVFFVYKQSLRNLFYLYVIVFIGSLFGVFESIGNYFLAEVDLSDSRNAIYFSDNQSGYVTGFRFDFFVFSMVPIVYYFWAKNKKILKDDPKLDNFLKIYIALNMYMNIFNFIPYYDRFAAYSWFIWPLLNVYIAQAINKKYIIYTLLALLFMSTLAFRFYNWQWFFPPL